MPFETTKMGCTDSCYVFRSLFKIWESPVINQVKVVIQVHENTSACMRTSAQEHLCMRSLLYMDM